MSRPNAATLIGLLMDTTKSLSSAASVPSANLLKLGRGADSPVIVDVTKPEAFYASAHLLPGALRRDPAQVGQWAGSLPPADAVLVYCALGHEVGINTMAALRAQGINASYLEGGIAAWGDAGLPLADKPVGKATRWITRERPKIDRIACPWLIRRFVDTEAEFLYVPTDRVAALAQKEIATAYDVAPQVAATPFSHDGDQCSFDVFIKHYRLGLDPALRKLADMVRGADTDRLDLAPQSAGLLAVSLGMSHNHADDHAMLEAMLPVYDALYRWCCDAALGQDEKHNWKPQGAAA